MTRCLPFALAVALAFCGAGCDKLKKIASPITVTVQTKSIDVQADVIRLKPGIKILFETSSDKLLADSYPILDEVYEVMKQNAGLKLRVEGHTDDVGGDDSNLKLSDKRAASVRAYLVDKGIAADRLESAGCGEAVPVADNATDDGKQQNRRVEFVILKSARVATCKKYGYTAAKASK
jgi:outer membrane protein OmpA-like peptidoglycan-associated protein